MGRTKRAGGNAKVKKQKKPAGIMVKKKVSHVVRFTNMKVNTKQKFSVTRAKMSERMSHICANLMLKLYRLQHPSHPVKRVAATETIKDVKAIALERRMQKVAHAADIATRKQPVVHDHCAYNMAKHT